MNQWWLSSARQIYAKLGLGGGQLIHVGRNECRHPLQWRHNECDGVSNHQPHDCLFTQAFIQVQINENTKAPRHWLLCGEFTSNAENVSIWWRHHAWRTIPSNMSSWIKLFVSQHCFHYEIDYASVNCQIYNELSLVWVMAWLRTSEYPRSHNNFAFIGFCVLGCVFRVASTGEFPSQMPVARSFVFFDLRLNKRSIRRWFETSSRPIWRQSNDIDEKVCQLLVLRFPPYYRVTGGYELFFLRHHVRRKFVLLV